MTMLDPTFNGKNIVPVNNINPSLLDDPEDQRGDGQGVGDHRREGAGGGVGRDRQMITEQAPAVPWFWDNHAEHPVRRTCRA